MTTAVKRQLAVARNSPIAMHKHGWDESRALEGQADVHEATPPRCEQTCRAGLSRSGSGLLWQ
jgi:hypothetical protein